MIKNALFIDRVKNDHILNWLSGFIYYLNKLGVKSYETWQGKVIDYEKYDIFIIWNGNLDYYKPIVNEIKKRNKKLLFTECGWFPQRKYYYLDSDGVNANSSIMKDKLDWIGEKHLYRLDEFRKQYVGNRFYNTKNEYVLVPLQIESDTNVTKFSPFKKMQDFIHHCEETFPKDKIIFKSHPVLANIPYRTRHTIVRKGNFMDLSQNAKLVYGINSTCLLESLLQNVPTISIGDGFISAHINRTEKLLAALIDKQIPVGEDNLDYWLKEYINE